jgi:hypothetical protein
MKSQIKSTDISELICRTRAQKIAEFGRLDLPLEVQVLARNLASIESITSLQALNKLILETGSLKELVKDTRKKARRIRRRASRAGTGGSSKGFFGITTLLPGAPPLQGGLPGSGKSSKR